MNNAMLIAFSEMKICLGEFWKGIWDKVTCIQSRAFFLHAFIYMKTQMYIQYVLFFKLYYMTPPYFSKLYTHLMTKFQFLGRLLQWLNCNTNDHNCYTNDITLVTKHLNTFWYRIYREKPTKSIMLRIPPDMKAKTLRFTNLRTDWVTPMTLSYPSDIRYICIISGRYV
jgi:hypothetical protein